MHILRGNNKKYVAVELPPIFDIDEYMESIGFEYNRRMGYSKGDMCITIAADRFYCTRIEHNNDFSCDMETVCCHLSFIPDIWMINMLLTQIDFI
jgi:hypothetical protein